MISALILLCLGLAVIAGFAAAWRPAQFVRGLGVAVALIALAMLLARVA